MKRSWIGWSEEEYATLKHYKLKRYSAAAIVDVLKKKHGNTRSEVAINRMWHKNKERLLAPPPWPRAPP